MRSPVMTSNPGSVKPQHPSVVRRNDCRGHVEYSWVCIQCIQSCSVDSDVIWWGMLDAVIVLPWYQSSGIIIPCPMSVQSPWYTLAGLCATLRSIAESQLLHRWSHDLPQIVRSHLLLGGYLTTKDAVVWWTDVWCSLTWWPTQTVQRPAEGHHAPLQCGCLQLGNHRWQLHLLEEGHSWRSSIVWSWLHHCSRGRASELERHLSSQPHAHTLCLKKMRTFLFLR